MRYGIDVRKLKRWAETQSCPAVARDTTGSGAADRSSTSGRRSIGAPGADVVAPPLALMAAEAVVRVADTSSGRFAGLVVEETRKVAEAKQCEN